MDTNRLKRLCDLLDYWEDQHFMIDSNENRLYFQGGFRDKILFDDTSTMFVRETPEDKIRLYCEELNKAIEPIVKKYKDDIKKEIKSLTNNA